MRKELKKIDLAEGSFIANGNKYTILSAIPLSRYREFKKLQARLVYGMDVKTLLSNCIKAFNYLNSPKPEPANAAIVIHNIMNGIKDMEDESREDPAIAICSLIIIRDGEDVGTFDKALSSEKISDWEKEGLDPNDFFQLALISMETFKETFALYMNQQAKSE